jgi:hypothetical protein
MRRQPFFKYDRSSYSINGSFAMPLAVMIRKPLACFETGQALVGVIDGQMEVGCELRPEGPRGSCRGTFGAVHVERQTNHQLAGGTRADPTS